MKEKYLALVNQSFVYLTLSLAFLLPVFFVPVTTEYYEFNKLALSAVITALMVVLWCVKMLIDGKFEITKAPVNLPILLLVAVYAISTYLSISKYTSVFGSYGRWNNSVIVAVVCALLYFVVSVNITSKDAIKKVIFAFAGGATLSSLVVILSYAQVYVIPAAFTHFRNFSLAGSALAASGISALAVIILFSELLGCKKMIAKYALGVLCILNFVAVALIGSIPGYGLLIAGVITAFLMTPSVKVVESKFLVSVLGVVFVLVGVVFAVPSFKNTLKLGYDYPKDLKLNAGASWIVTTSSLRDFPLFGTGPSTFYLNFSHYRPLSLNVGNLWTVGYDKPFNEFFDVAATLGIVGFLVYLLLVVKVFKLAKRSDHSTTNVALSSSLISMLVFFSLSNSFVSMNIIFYLFIGLFISYLIAAAGSFGPLVDSVVESVSVSFAVYGKTTSLTTGTVAIMFALPLLALSGFASYFGVKTYAAEVMMRNSVTAASKNDGLGLFNSQKSAIALNPYIDVYHSSFAETSILLANSIASSKKAEELSDNEKNSIKDLIGAAISESRVTTELMNVSNPGFWEQRGRLYSGLVGTAKDADSWAVGAYTRALQLNPTNPGLRLSLGGVYFAAKNYPMAEAYFRAAVSLKSDYANAHYNLAQSLKAQKKYVEAVSEIQAVMSLIDMNTEDYKAVSEELKALQALPEVAGAAENAKPSVSDLQQQQTAPTAKQEPLTKPGETAKPAVVPVQ